VSSEHDACALVAVARKDARPTREVLDAVLHGMACLAHRSGLVDGEGDGAGVLTDIPRELWANALTGAGAERTLAWSDRFAVGHFFLSEGDDRAAIAGALERSGIAVLAIREGTTDESALGPRGRLEEPRFLQLGLLLSRAGRTGSRALYEAGVAIEQATATTVVSLSRHTAVYKLRGAGHQLTAYFADLADPLFATSVAFGHNRYATNTSTSFTRVQPFAAFAHNGEINTISRLREESRALGLPLSRDGSDSQDVDAVLRALVLRHGLDPIEATELLFPPIVNEIKRMDGELQDAYVQARAALGPLAQGPAAILARLGNTCVFGVDALGLRPLWHVETEDEHVFASERGFVPLERYVADPYPLGPGEHVALRCDRGWRLLDQPAVRSRFAAVRRRQAIAGMRHHLSCGGPAEPPVAHGRWEVGVPPDEVDDVSVRRERQFAAFGFEPDDLKQAAFMAETANEPIGSLGYDGPLGALAPRANLADHLHETVAVVTNPAIDREREIEHFSTRVLLGPRPHPGGLGGGAPQSPQWLELATPLLLGGHAPETGLVADDFRALARERGTWLLEDVIARLGPPLVLEADRDWDEHPRDALARLGAEAARAVRRGTTVLIVRDRGVVAEGRAWLDPLLVIAAAHRSLVAQPPLRRRCAIVVSAGSLRNLHDVMTALALGADAVNPYLLLEYAIAGGDPDALGNLVEALRKGVEKVLSTLGIHELRGYGRQVAAVGLAPEVARFIGIEGFCASDGAGLGWERIADDGFARASMLRERRDARLEPAFRLWPRAWKAALAVANGEAPYTTYAERLRELETAHPVSLRHLIDFVRPGAASPPPAEPQSTDQIEPTADTSAGEHAAPFYISSMSFGSQGETAYRAYAEAMARLDLLCINGEGGELPDLIGRYPRNRGQQIASGRFGVSAVLANSSNYLEIKIGQGAKPGEGGHLPARKVSWKVALARNAQPGVDLISPSNNHDIYSIEDLAQVVHELKTVNPRARVAVKVPVVPDIGVIAVGIAKAGADIITLSGYDGGTGAARQHALRRAGLPVEIGVTEAHRALVSSGLRDLVELWCDGGMKSALDVAKMLCLGADRIGFGTLAMVAIGCTICRGCQLDTCHVGIATQLGSVAEATERGVKRFEPREFEHAVANLARFFAALQIELSRIATALGVRATADLVGRADLLVQTRGTALVDLTRLLEPVDWSPPGRRDVRIVAGVAAETVTADAEQALAAGHRFVGTETSGAIARVRIAGAAADPVASTFREGSVAGNGFAAYATDGVALTVRGGAQDGAAKTALGGAVAILKARNARGQLVDGAVGKCFAYGAQRGRFLVQGGADARAAIRLSGAEVVFGGDLRGFAFEYMTGGAAVVLGDPGRWICSGMSGGVVYLRHDPARGLDDAALHDRLAKGAKVHLRAPRDEDLPALGDLLASYVDALQDSGQADAATAVGALLADPASNFRVVRPGAEITDQTISTE